MGRRLTEPPFTILGRDLMHDGQPDPASPAPRVGLSPLKTMESQLKSTVLKQYKEESLAGSSRRVYTAERVDVNNRRSREHMLAGNTPKMKSMLPTIRYLESLQTRTWTRATFTSFLRAKDKKFCSYYRPINMWQPRGFASWVPFSRR